MGAHCSRSAGGALDITDAISLFGFLFFGTRAPACLDAADANGSGVIDISDCMYLLEFTFLGGPPPPDPGGPSSPCGPDPDPPGSPGRLGCEDYEC